jgi:hypothetical protein
VYWLETNADGSTRIGANVTSAGPLVFHDNVTLTANTIISGSGSDIVFEGTVGGNNALTLNHGWPYGNTSFYKPVEIGSLTTAANGTTWILGGAVNTIGAQTYRNAVRIGGSPAVLSGAGVTFNGEVTGLPLVVNTIGGTATTFNGPVSVNSLTTGVDGTTNVNGGSIATNGAQSYGNAVVLGVRDATFLGLSVTFNGSVSGQQSVNVGTPDYFTATFGGPVDVLSIRTDAGTTQIGANITTSGSQSYHNNVTLTTDTTITGGSVMFGGTVSGNYALTVNGCRGGTCGYSVFFTNPVNIGSLTTNVSVAQILGSITTTGPQTYNNDVMVFDKPSLTGAGVTVGGSVSGALAWNGKLIVNTTGGAPIVFKAPFSAQYPLTSLTTNGDGITDLNGGYVRTVGPQTYNNNVVLSADAVLEGAPVTFNGTVTQGPYALTVNSTGGTPTSSTAATSQMSLVPLLRPTVDSDVLLFASARAAVAAETDRSGRADLRESAGIASIGERATGATDATPRIKLPACVEEQRNGAACAR